MQDPANIPCEVMCQLFVRKQASMVCQFHNICILSVDAFAYQCRLTPTEILHEPPPMPMSMPAMSIPEEVAAAADVVVAVPMSMPFIEAMTDWSIATAIVKLLFKLKER